MVVVVGFILSIGCGGGEETTGASGGEDALVVVNNRDYYSLVHSALAHAQESIHMVMYVLKYYPGESSPVNLLLDDLVDAHSRGVDVRVLLEGCRGVVDTSAVNYLTERGIAVVLDPENITTHAKMIVLDAQAVILGSTNWSNSALNSNNETNVEIKDPSIAELYEEYFQTLWEVPGHD